MDEAQKLKMLQSREATKLRVAQIIGRGAELIRKRGWCIGALRDDSGRLCLMGAIEEASKHETRAIRYRAYDEVNRVLRRQNSGIHEWNDEQTSGDRVADLLEGVAKKVDSTYQIEKILHPRRTGLLQVRASSRMCCRRRLRRVSVPNHQMVQLWTP